MYVRLNRCNYTEHLKTLKKIGFVKRTNFFRISITIDRHLAKDFVLNSSIDLIPN